MEPGTFDKDVPGNHRYGRCDLVFAPTLGWAGTSTSAHAIDLDPAPVLLARTKMIVPTVDEISVINRDAALSFLDGYYRTSFNNYLRPQILNIKGALPLTLCTIFPGHENLLRLRGRGIFMVAMLTTAEGYLLLRGGAVDITTTIVTKNVLATLDT